MLDLLSANVLQERLYYLHDEGGEIEAQKNTIVRPALKEYEPVPLAQSLGDFLGDPMPGGPGSISGGGTKILHDSTEKKKEKSWHPGAQGGWRGRQERLQPALARLPTRPQRAGTGASTASVSFPSSEKAQPVVSGP